MGINLNQEIIILGRGIAALSCAYAFLRRGFSNIKIIGKISPPGSASWAAQGVLSSKGLLLAEQDLFYQKLLSQQKSWEWLTNLEKDSGMKLSWKKGGVWEAFFDEEDRQSTISRVYKREFFGYSKTQDFDWALAKSSEKNFTFPWVSKDPKSLFYYPNDGYLDPKSVLAGLEKVLEKAGIQVLEDHVSFVEKHENLLILKTKNNNVTFKTKNLLLAMGSFLPQFLKNFSSCFGFQNDFRFVYGQIYERILSDDKFLAEDFVLVKGLNSIVAHQYKQSFGVYSSKHESLDKACLLNHFAEQEKLLSHLTKQLYVNQDLFLDRSRPIWGVRLLASNRKPILGWFQDPEFSPSCRVGICGALYKSGFQLAAWMGDEMVERFLKSFSL